jgi:23S rRNA (uracil1939-C5)-methyltransferase/tRNA (uracil-5-)-methyltransferase
MSRQNIPVTKTVPLCPIFGECGGCQYQDISYSDELLQKEAYLKNLLQKDLPLDSAVFQPIVASPKEYHYRHRLDLKLLKTKDQSIFMGFSPNKGYRVAETVNCAIASEPISKFLPELKKQASAKMPVKYRNANLVVRTGDDGRVFWGGIGRRSLWMNPPDYFWTVIEGKKIFYSLDTFFQANLSILPKLIQVIKGLGVLDKETSFYDLYGGVGLFGICFFDQVKNVVLVEENIYAVKLAEHNVKQNGIKNLEIFSGRMEDIWGHIPKPKLSRKIAMIDPPRAGLSKEAAEALANAKQFSSILYLSCNPKALVSDLGIFISKGWHIKRIIPFDFFPKTRHIETLVFCTVCDSKY